MKGKGSRQSRTTYHRVKDAALVASVFLGVVPLPILAYVLGTHVLTHASAGAAAQYLLSSQLLLFFIALLVASLGGLVIWSAATSLGLTTPVEGGLEDPDGAPVTRRPQSGPVMHSTRMRTTIERQASELSHVTQPLESANRDLESVTARLREFSFADEVTRLYNRRFFSVRLEEEVARHRRFGHPLSVVLLDLDGFKALNDERGHLARDETLRAVADVLSKSSRGIDVICRYGGDEFAVLLVETPRAGARPYARRVRDLLSASSFPHEQPVTASFGVASLSEHATGDDLVRAAGEALAAAKRAGTNCVAVWEELGLAPGTEPETPAT